MTSTCTQACFHLYQVSGCAPSTNRAADFYTIISTVSSYRIPTQHYFHHPHVSFLFTPHHKLFQPKLFLLPNAMHIVP